MIDHVHADRCRQQRKGQKRPTCQCRVRDVRHAHEWT